MPVNSAISGALMPFIRRTSRSECWRAPLEDRRNPYPLHLAPAVKVHPTLGLVHRRALWGAASDSSVERPRVVPHVHVSINSQPLASAQKWSMDFIHPVHSVQLESG